ncbi:MAG: hypothetical protein JXA57_03320 [Armatimonadetes bacterium]|nr:hypothetical protein [Armatimonadota bacterium]
MGFWGSMLANAIGTLLGGLVLALILFNFPKEVFLGPASRLIGALAQADEAILCNRGFFTVHVICHRHLEERARDEVSAAGSALRQAAKNAKWFPLIRRLFNRPIPDREDLLKAADYMRSLAQHLPVFGPDEVVNWEDRAMQNRFTADKESAKRLLIRIDSLLTPRRESPNTPVADKNVPQPPASFRCRCTIPPETL